VTIAGSTWGGSMLKVRFIFIGRGMHLEFRHPGYPTPIVTSIIQEIREFLLSSPPGIRVNVVSPGPISIPIYGKLGLPREALEAFAANIVVGNKSWSMLLTLTESQMPVNVEGRKKSMLR